MISFSECGAYGHYLFEYRHDGSEWGLEIVAKSPEDARQRLNALSWATYKGEIAAKIDVPARQIEKFEHYEYREDRRGRLAITRLGIYDNPNHVWPHEVTNYRDRL